MSFFSYQLGTLRCRALFFIGSGIDPSSSLSPAAFLIIFELIMNSNGIIFCFMGVYSLLENRKQRFKDYLNFSFVMTLNYIIATFLSIYAVIAYKYKMSLDMYILFVRYVVGLALTAAFMIFSLYILMKFWRNWKHDDVAAESELV
ncbi:hypothetical protein BKA69DRAFT_1126672 [Paraphysoderma sedebokerense]|nr:hypothetical protein BKA69DRAFT_1126672 [Paraphysoderma sedebokerense]